MDTLGSLKIHQVSKILELCNLKLKGHIEILLKIAVKNSKTYKHIQTLLNNPCLQTKLAAKLSTHLLTNNLKRETLFNIHKH